MFDFAMTLSHKTVHNFFCWAFVHCTALPMLIFHDGLVQLSNDDAADDDDHSAVVLAWGNNEGSKESRLNTKIKFQHYTCVGWVRFGRSPRRVDFPTLGRTYQLFTIRFVLKIELSRFHTVWHTLLKIGD